MIRYIATIRDALLIVVVILLYSGWSNSPC
jgi:hypothetical protein